jgi:diguanylate cyclase (GGDEF)-like protein
MNRRCFLEALRRALRTIRRDGGTGALLVLDLDDFKVINDTAGHPEGDRVLRAAAEAMRRRLRTSDRVGRLGGEEFAALLMDVTPDQAVGVAEEIMRAVEAITVEHADTVLTTSVSVGIGMIDDETTLDEDALLADADRAMYERKAARRDG